jgi:NADPH:quinone reductase-like Zn-dependent oxidoreductase
LSYGVNGLAAVLMVGIFAQTGGLTGAEVAIAGGSSAVGQQLLAAVLGDQAVRSLTETARADLERRIGEDVVGVEAQRFLSVLERHRPGDRGARLREVGHQLVTALDR